jgi:hypothetical protein
VHACVCACVCVPILCVCVCRSGHASNFRALTPDAWSGGLLGLALTTIRYRGRELLLGSSHGGLVYVIPSTHSKKSLYFATHLTAIR